MVLSEKQKSEKKYKRSSCPMSQSRIGQRCNAGNPQQILIKNPESLIGQELIRKLGIKPNNAINRCRHCDVVYINTGVPGTERLLGYWTPQGFKVSA
jgi:homospermidine synthase